MTKKHFIAAAAIVRNMHIQTPDESRPSAEAAAWVLIELAETFNPRFDRQRFLRACGLVD